MWLRVAYSSTFYLLPCIELSFTVIGCGSIAFECEIWLYFSLFSAYELKEMSAA